MARSRPAEATRVPPGWNTAANTSSVCPSSMRPVPALTSHTRTVRSRPPAETSWRPSGLNWTDLISAVWPVNRVVALVVCLGIAGQAQAQFRYTTLDVPGSIFTNAQGINPSGQIVGVYGDAAGLAHGFLLNQGVYTTLDVPGAINTLAHGINASG